MSDVGEADDEEWQIERLQTYRDESVKAAASFIYNLLVAVLTTGIATPLIAWLIGTSDVDRAASSGILLYIPLASITVASLLHVWARMTLESLIK